MLCDTMTWLHVVEEKQDITKKCQYLCLPPWCCGTDWAGQDHSLLVLSPTRSVLLYQTNYRKKLSSNADDVMTCSTGPLYCRSQRAKTLPTAQRYLTTIQDFTIRILQQRVVQTLVHSSCCSANDRDLSKFLQCRRLVATWNIVEYSETTNHGTILMKRGERIAIHYSAAPVAASGMDTLSRTLRWSASLGRIQL